MGKGDYPKDFPLKEVYIISKHCAGGIILGFEQLYVEKGIRKRNISGKEISIEKPISVPTPWNNLEAGILFGLKLPLLIFKENDIEGGIFDIGITNVFVHKMPDKELNGGKMNGLKQVIFKWFAQVSTKYHEY